MCSTDTDSTAMLSAALALTQEMGIDKLEHAERNRQTRRHVGRAKGKCACKVTGLEAFSLCRQRREEVTLSITT